MYMVVIEVCTVKVFQSCCMFEKIYNIILEKLKMAL